MNSTSIKWFGKKSKVFRDPPKSGYLILKLWMICMKQVVCLISMHEKGGHGSIEGEVREVTDFQTSNIPDFFKTTAVYESCHLFRILDYQTHLFIQIFSPKNSQRHIQGKNTVFGRKIRQKSKKSIFRLRASRVSVRPLWILSNIWGPQKYPRKFFGWAEKKSFNILNFFF